MAFNSSSPSSPRNSGAGGLDFQFERRGGGGQASLFPVQFASYTRFPPCETSFRAVRQWFIQEQLHMASWEPNPVQKSPKKKSSHPFTKSNRKRGVGYQKQKSQGACTPLRETFGAGTSPPSDIVEIEIHLARLPGEPIEDNAIRPWWPLPAG